LRPLLAWWRWCSVWPAGYSGARSGAPPLKIGQLFGKKKAAEPEVKHEEAPPLEEVTPESLMQQ
jgi:hypothetical protein